MAWLALVVQLKELSLSQILHFEKLFDLCSSEFMNINWQDCMKHPDG